MKSRHSRRDFLASISAAALVPPMAGAAAPTALAYESLGDTLGVIRGAGGNIVVLRDAKGLLFIDGGLKVHAANTLKLAGTHLGAALRPHTLINTHWHAEQTGLNEQLGKQGAQIIAHEHTKLWLSTTVRYQPDGPPIRPLPVQARPNRTTLAGGELTADDETLRYGYLAQAHTDGDLYVKLERANVLVTGGVVAGNGWPTPDWVTGGWINGTVGGYRTLIAQCDDATRVVTANGARLATKADLQAELEILAKLSDQLGRMMRAGAGPADVLAAAPAKDYAATMGDPTQFLVESFKSLWPRLAPDA